MLTPSTPSQAAAVTVMVTVAVAELSALAAVTVCMVVPMACALPEITPRALMLMPAGSSGVTV